MSDAEKIEFLQILLNGEPYQIEANSSVEMLLQQLARQKGRAESTVAGSRLGAIAVEVNSDIVPRDRFAQTKLAANDAVEVVTLVGGG